MKQQGVTLIQMMFALAMAAVLTQLGLPAYARLSENLHKAAVARDLAQTLRSARSHAVLQGQPVLVQSLEKDWGKGWRVMLEHNRQVLREQRLARPVNILANTGGEVRFSALGTPWNGFGGRLELCENTVRPSHFQVVLASSGRIRLRTDERQDSLCAKL